MKNIIVLLCLVLNLPLFADTAREIFKEGYATNINTMIALSSDDYMGAGRYKLADDETLKVYHLPIKYNFDPIYKDFNLYVNSTISRAEIEDPFGYRVSLNMFKLGFGLRYKPKENFYISVGYSLIYSVFKSTFNYSKFVGTPYYDVFKANDDLLNSRQENRSKFEYEFLNNYCIIN
jgi:hypothetical protein